jgi:hypothetical protein
MAAEAPEPDEERDPPDPALAADDDAADDEVGDEEVGDEDVRDTLPADLDASGFVGPYLFPNNSRRRIPGVVYVVMGVGCVVLWLLRGDGGTLVNAGTGIAGVVLVLVGLYHLQAGWDLAHDENDALVSATRAVGFPVGHASAQLGWRGVRSRPTWRILLYSNESPPSKRGLVLVDGVDGAIVDTYVEANPEDWSAYDA